jgi:hypothetical protein
MTVHKSSKTSNAKGDLGPKEGGVRVGKGELEGKFHRWVKSHRGLEGGNC